MASDSETEIYLSSDEAFARPGLWWRGIYCGAIAGLLVGLADAALALRAGNEIVGAADVLPVMGWYAAAFAPCGLVAAIVARRFEWSYRALGLLIGIGALSFLVGAWLNVHWLDDFTSVLSIAVDAVLLIAAYLWIRYRYHGPGSDEVRLGRWTLSAILGLAAAFGLQALGPARDDGPPVHARAVDADAPRPNVLVFMVDTLRADALGCYGYDRPTSPEVDAFAADATVFLDCRATTSWTKPSVASLLTSLYPTSHACVQQREILVPDAETLPEVFRSAGWRTAAFVDNPFVTPEFGFGQGFDRVDYVAPSVFANGTLLGKVLFMTRLLSLVGEPLGVGKHHDRGAQALVEKGLLPWIDSDDDPWFAYVHTMEPHLPYDPPRADAEAFGLPSDAVYGATPPYNGILPFQKAPEPPAGVRENLRAQYDGEVRDASRWFGRLLDGLRERGALENTIVVFVADHGEEFYEHGGWTHGHSLHSEVVHVPLIVRVPDSVAGAATSRGRRVGGVASLLDVFPTLVDLAGVLHPRGAETNMGWSLVPTLLAGEERSLPLAAVPSGRALLAEVSMGPVTLRSLREERWHLIRATAPPARRAAALFDFVSDPTERRDAATSESLQATQMETRLGELFDALEKIALRGASRDIDAETAERLKSIGYLQGK